MRLHRSLAVSLAALALLANAQTKPDRTLEVKLNYTGAGKVDQNHKIFVFLFDSPDFMQGNAMPIANQAATAKDGTVTFSDLSAATIYAVAAFDPKGEYDGMSGPPPAGSIMRSEGFDQAKNVENDDAVRRAAARDPSATPPTSPIRRTSTA